MSLWILLEYKQQWKTIMLSNKLSSEKVWIHQKNEKSPQKERKNVQKEQVHQIWGEK